MPQTLTFSIQEAGDLTHFEPSTINVSGTFTIGSTGSLFLCDTTSAFTISLPNASNSKNRVLTIKKVSADGNTLTIDTSDSSTIDGASSTPIVTQWDLIQVQSDGTNWYVISP